MTSGALPSQQSPVALPWRVGRKVGRTIYAMVGPEPGDGDVLIGVMDSAELAGEAVTSHNHRRPRGRGWPI